MHAGDGLRVLRGERGDHATAVGAERAESLEVGEHASAAGRVNAGDGDDVRDAGGLAGRCSRRAAFAGSG